jgi:hypothetical protein
MDGTEVIINEREAEYQDTAPAPAKPSVEEFKEIVERHCHKWGVSSVDNLCQEQTQALIEELAQHFR